MQIDMTKINEILEAARAERNRLNEDLDRILARARWSFRMRYPAKKPVLTVIQGRQAQANS